MKNISSSSRKKGFTIVELVIVIAVIAILAAVLIPTFSGIIKDANRSSAYQTCKNAYKSFHADMTAVNRSVRDGLVFKYDDYVFANMNNDLYELEFVGKAKYVNNLGGNGKCFLVGVIANAPAKERPAIYEMKTDGSEYSVYKLTLPDTDGAYYYWVDEADEAGIGSDVAELKSYESAYEHRNGAGITQLETMLAQSELNAYDDYVFRVFTTSEGIDHVNIDYTNPEKIIINCDGMTQHSIVCGDNGDSTPFSESYTAAETATITAAALSEIVTNNVDYIEITDD